MATQEIEQYLNRGVLKLGQGDALSALVHFEKAVNAGGGTPECMSYLGYCIAKERGQTARGKILCREALDEDPGNPLHFLNLAKICLLCRDKDGALEALRQGAACGVNEELSALLEEVGSRKPPVFSFLHRDHLLNRYAGVVFSRLGLR
ncbi:hypothetical protein KI809_03240 [Geobacter pelophilus]|uniref:Tetratricopeptide repeat-containing protein n=1 Tax=Geoanaerobacter pelophilus TaxID=60036 RepID=A0AAW4L503_9BACT|nr:hypothetical protein [Geoanaerobacter pelophilus]MBT0663306.1 hypothetical protein [Geoanaerobacter pelophilus]